MQDNNIVENPAFTPKTVNLGDLAKMYDNFQKEFTAQFKGIPVKIDESLTGNQYYIAVSKELYARISVSSELLETSDADKTALERYKEAERLFKARPKSRQAGTIRACFKYAGRSKPEPLETSDADLEGVLPQSYESCCPHTDTLDHWIR